MFEEQEALLIASAEEFTREPRETDFLKELAKQDDNLPDQLIAYMAECGQKLAASAFMVIEMEKAISGIEIDRAAFTVWLADFIHGSAYDVARLHREARAIDPSLN